MNADTMNAEQLLLQTVAGNELRAHLATCPTCLVSAADAHVLAPAAPGEPAPAACPTCGVESVEYGMLLEMDSVLTSLGGFERLAAVL